MAGREGGTRHGLRRFGAARQFGIFPCFYIILGFDVFSNQSGVSAAEYLAQQETALTELLTDYGPIL